MTAPDAPATVDAAPASDPATDPVGTVRVHPDHDRCAVLTRRYIRTSTDLGAPTDPVPWALLTGWGHLFATDAYVDDWPVQPWSQLAGVLGHPETVR